MRIKFLILLLKSKSRLGHIWNCNYVIVSEYHVKMHRLHSMDMDNNYPDDQRFATVLKRSKVNRISQISILSSPLSASSLPLRSLLRINDSRLLNDELRFLRSPVCMQQ